MKKLKIILFFAASGFTLSLVCGLISHAAVLSLIIKAVCWGVVFGILGGVISFLFNGVLNVDGSFDSGYGSGESEPAKSTGNVVDIRIDDDELEGTGHDNAYLVGSSHQMLNAEDLRASARSAPEASMAASAVKIDSGFVPVSNLGDMYKKEPDSSAGTTIDTSAPAPKAATSGFTDVSAAGGEELDTLPDVGDLGFAGSNESGAYNESVNNESDFATGSSRASKEGNNPMIGNSELIAKAISSVLAREN